MLKELMDRRAVSTRALAAETGIPQSTISAYPTGRGTQKPEHILAISKYFGTSMEYLLFGEDSRARSLSDVLTEQVYAGWLRVRIERAIPDKRFIEPTTSHGEDI